MARHTDMEKRFLERYLAPLVGCTITTVKIKVEDGRCWPVITAKPIRAGRGNETFELEISRDSEGNGPGWIFGLPHPGEESKTEG